MIGPNYDHDISLPGGDLSGFLNQATAAPRVVP